MNGETLVGYKREDIQKIVDYLEERPYREVCTLVPILYNCQNIVIDEKREEEVKQE